MGVHEGFGHTHRPGLVLSLGKVKEKYSGKKKAKLADFHGTQSILMGVWSSPKQTMPVASGEIFSNFLQEAELSCRAKTSVHFF